MRIGVFLVAVHMTWGALLVTAGAQDADARELFRRGEAAYSVGNYDVAIREWTAAYALDPRPRIQFNLAQAYERLGKLKEAADALKRFLDKGDPDDPMYADANARLAALQQRLSLTGVVVKGGPDGGKIFVDDKDWGRTPRPDKIPLSPGAHKVVVKWEGRADYVANIVVPAGQVVELGITAGPPKEPAAPADGAAPDEPSAAPAAPPPEPDDTAKAGTSTPWLWYGLAAGGGAVAIAGLGYGLERNAALGKANCGGDVACDDGEGTVKTQRTVAFVTAGVGLLAAGAFLTTALLGGDTDDRSARLRCAPGVLSASCQVSF